MPVHVDKRWGREVGGVACVCVWAKCERVVRGVPGECRAVLAFHGSPSPTEGFEGTERDSLKLSLW